MMQTSNQTKKPIRAMLQRAWQIVREDRDTYLVLNILYYGLVILGMAYVAFFDPKLQERLLQSTGIAFTSGPLAAVGEAYVVGDVMRSIALTLGVNLILGSLLQMTLPTLLIPFFGLLVGAFRAILWGLLLSPSHSDLIGPMIPHTLTLVLEGQAYILVMLAAFMHARAWTKPQTYGLDSRWHGYLEGLRRTAWTYLLVVLLLVAAAVYEALDVIFLAPWFASLLGGQ